MLQTLTEVYSGIDYYNGTTKRVLADNLNDVYILTIAFKCSSANANQTYLRLQLDAENGTPYERVGVDISFPKGNDVAHEFSPSIPILCRPKLCRQWFFC